MANQKPKIVVSPVVTAAYAWLARPDEGQEYSDGKFKVTLVMDKDDKEVASFIEDMMTDADAVAKAEFGKLPSNLRYPFKDGDEADKEEFKGKWLLTAKTKFQPGFVGPDKGSIGEDDIPSSGDLIRASFMLKAYATGGNKGVTSQLRNVMLMEKRNYGLGPSGDFGELEAVQSDKDEDSTKDEFDIAI